MQRVFSDTNTVLAGLVSSVLEAAGIACLVRNQYLSGALGELPASECWPQVWVLSDDDAPRALKLIAQTLHRDEACGDSWACPDCGEQLEPQFAQCWQCGAQR
jgi:Putative prokaryotic signal transducing protein